MKRTKPLSDESLLSLLVRLTELNSYEALSLLKGLIFERPNSLQPLRDNLEYPLKPSTYECLTSLTQLDEAILYQCTLHRFAPIFTPPFRKVVYMQLPSGSSVPFFPDGQYPKQLRPQHSAQFCPACLEEEAHYTLKWTPIAASACLKHKCLLVDRCHKCCHGISSTAIAKGWCERCQAELSKTKTSSICKDELGLLVQSILQSWFMNFTCPFSDIALLPQQPARILYWIIEELQGFLRSVRNERWTYIHRLEEHEELLRTVALSEDEQPLLSPYESYQLYTTACKSIINWPEGFFDFLNRYGNKDAEFLDPSFQEAQPRTKGKLISGILSTSLGQLYTEWLLHRWNSPEYAFLQEVFNCYIADNYWFSDLSELKSFCKKNPELTERCAYASMNAAADFLNLSSDEIEFLVGSESIKSTSSDRDTEKYVKREAVFLLRDAQRRIIPLSGVATRLGLSTSVIKNLVRVGLFSRGDILERDFSAEDVTTIGEALFLKEVVQHTKVLSQDGIDDVSDYINLQEAEHLLSVAELNITTLFSSLLKGKLCAYTQFVQTPKLSNLLFLSNDIQMLAVRSTNRKPFLLGEEKISNILGVQKEAFAQWTRKGLIAPSAMYGRELFFEPDCIDQFRQNNIFGDEVTKLLGLQTEILALPIWSSPRSLSATCAKGLDISKGEKCMFDRELLIRWRNERLTFDESVSMLDISTTVLLEWIKKGKILHIDSINDRPTWLLKQEILRVIEHRSLNDKENICTQRTFL